MLSPNETLALQVWLDRAQVPMRLSDWEFTAKAEPPRGPKTTIAASLIHHHSDTAEIHLGDAFFDKNIEDRRRTLTHELLHCHLYRLRLVSRRGMSKREREFSDTLEELAIEQLTRIIAPLMPDIPEELRRGKD